MELRHLRYFVAVSEYLNFRQAARSLGIAQPPLSVQIRKLEEELGTPLFVRCNRRIQLTPAGHVFLIDARDIVGRTQQAIQRVQDEAAGREGSLTLAFTEGAFSEVVTKRLRKFGRAHRGLRISIRNVERGDCEGADALFADFLESELPAEGIPLARAVPQVAVSPKHRLGDRTDFLPSDLVGETILASSLQHRSAAERLLIPQLPQSVIVTGPAFDSLSHRFRQVSLGMGICFCSTADRGSLDASRTSLGGGSEEIVLALVPNPSSRAGSLPALIEAIGN